MYIGIDPGLKGGIAFLDANGLFLAAIDMPLTKTIAGKDVIDTSSIYHALKFESEKCIIAIEKVQAMPPARLPNGQSINMNVSMFTFGMGYGGIKAIASITADIILDITPQKWKKYFNLIGKDKKESVNKAIKIYPNSLEYLITKRGRLIDGRADALLLARYAYETIK